MHRVPLPVGWRAEVHIAVAQDVVATLEHAIGACNRLPAGIRKTGGHLVRRVAGECRGTSGNRGARVEKWVASATCASE